MGTEEHREVRGRRGVKHRLQSWDLHLPEQDSQSLLRRHTQGQQSSSSLFPESFTEAQSPGSWKPSWLLQSGPSQAYPHSWQTPTRWQAWETHGDQSKLSKLIIIKRPSSKSTTLLDAVFSLEDSSSESYKKVVRIDEVNSHGLC